MSIDQEMQEAVIYRCAILWFRSHSRSHSATALL